MKALLYKKCTRCHVIKDLCKFWARAASSDGRGSYCIACEELMRHHYRKDKSKNTHRVMLNTLKEQGLKYCPKCKVGKPFTEFGANARATDNLAWHCISCCRAFSKARPKEEKQKAYLRDKLKVRDTRLKVCYGITLEQYNKMLEQQNYKCAVCSKTVEENKKQLAVDHVHGTKKIRGLLCANCNVAVGFVQENSEIAIGISNYLLKWGKLA